MNTLFIVLLIFALLALIGVVIIIVGYVNQLYPFRRMTKDQENDCYDLNLLRNRNAKHRKK